MVDADSPTSTNQRLLGRYRDAYGRGWLLLDLGGAIEHLAPVLAVATFGLCLYFLASGVHRLADLALILLCAISLAAGVRALCWVAAIFIAALGDILLSTLEAAVNQSSLLNERDRQEVRRLRPGDSGRLSSQAALVVRVLEGLGAFLLIALLLFLAWFAYDVLS
jgi:hypothetical protein